MIDIHTQLKELLDRKGADYRVIEHEVLAADGSLVVRVEDAVVGSGRDEVEVDIPEVDEQEIGARPALLVPLRHLLQNGRTGDVTV